MKKILVIALTVLTLAVTAQSTQKQIGTAGDWVKAIAAASVGDKVYTAESNGWLVVTDPATAKRSTLGKDEFAQTRTMFSGNGKLYLVNFDGSLFNINLTTGAKEKIGLSSAYSDAFTWVVIGAKMYSVNRVGKLSETDLTTGTMKQIGQPGVFENTFRLFTAGGKLYSLEGSGSLYEINKADGVKTQLGANAEFKGMQDGIGNGDMIYLIDKSGYLFSAGSTGAKTKLSTKADYSSNKFLISGTNLYMVESTGFLYQITK